MPKLVRLGLAALALAAIALAPAIVFAAVADAGTILAAGPPAAPATSVVVVPWGDWIGQVAPWLITVLMALGMWAVRHLPPQIAGVLLASRVDQLLERAIAYGVNTTAGAVAGKTLDVKLGSAVLAGALRYAVTQAPSLVEQAGGAALVRQKIIARLYVGPEAMPKSEPASAAASEARATGTGGLYGHAWLGALLVMTLALAGCAQMGAAVEASDTALARMSRGSLPAACAIVGVAEGYFDALAPRISPTNHARFAAARTVADRICADRPADTASAMITLARAWADIQAATKAAP